MLQKVAVFENDSSILKVSGWYGLMSSMLFGEKVRFFNAAGLLEIHSEGFLTHWKDVDSQKVQWNRTEYIPTSSTFLNHKTNKKHVWNGCPCRTDL